MTGLSLPINSGGPHAFGAANSRGRVCYGCGAAILAVARTGRPRRYCNTCRGRREIAVRLGQALRIALRTSDADTATEIRALLQRIAR